MQLDLKSRTRAGPMPGSVSPFALVSVYLDAPDVENTKMVASGDCLFHRSTNWIVNASRWTCRTCGLYCDTWLPVSVTVFQDC